MAKIYWKLAQGSPEWFRLRRGIPTASEFSHIITEKKAELAAARFKYACKLIAERLVNWQALPLETIQHIEEGRANEPFAIGQLQAMTGLTAHKVGFVTTNDGRFGASPDRAIGGHPSLDVEDGSLAAVIEVKCPTVPKQIEYLLLGHDSAYRAQVQGQLYVAEADKATFYSYNPRTPAYHIETGRDEAFISRLAGALEQFHDELSEMTERAEALGVYQAFEQSMPADQEYADNIRRDPLTSEAELAALIEQEMRPDEQHRLGA